MLTSNLILTVLALAIPSAFAAPIPAADSSSSSVSKSKQGNKSAIDSTTQGVTVPPSSSSASGVVNPASNEVDPASGGELKSNSKSAVGTGKGTSKAHKHKSHKALKTHKHKSHKTHKTQEALQTQTTQNADAATQAATTQTLARRASPARVGSQIVIDDATFKLESLVSQASTAVFKTTVGGIPAYAKQNLHDIKFDDEVPDTVVASNALKNGLYIASGTAHGPGGSQWLITKVQPGKSFGQLVSEGKFSNKSAAIEKATHAVLHAQQTLAAGARFIQADDDPETWLFSDDLSTVNPTDMVTTISAYGGWSDRLANSQKREWENNFATVWDHYKKLSSGKPSPKKSSKSRRSPRSDKRF